MKRSGFSILEGLIIAGAVIVIGALIYAALFMRPSNNPGVISPSSAPAIQAASVDEIKTEQEQLDKEQDTQVDASLNELTTELNSL